VPLSVDQMEAIKQVVETAVSAKLTDLATGQQMAVQLIEDTLKRLSECQTHLKALTADLTLARHHEVDAQTALGIYRELVEQYQERFQNSETLIEQQREHIKSLEARVRDLELKVASLHDG